MTRIEDEARAAAEKLWPIFPNTPMDVNYFRRLGQRDGYIQGYLAASRREPSEASANVSNRPKDDISSGEMSVSEPSDTDERWEYGVRDDAPTSYYGTIVPTADLDEANFGASLDDRMTPVRRRKAGPWEVVPDEG